MNAVHIFPQVLETRHVETYFDVESNNTLWITLPESIDGKAPFFSQPLIDDMLALLQAIEQRGLTWPSSGLLQPIHYSIVRSSHPDYFNLGGDLEFFRDCIRGRDRDSLHHYSLTCAKILYELSTLLSADATSVALVQGRALGGGFETVLAADYIIAEEQSEFGFPEILFGLFPCTGGMGLLTQRIGARAAERMLGDARMYKAQTLKEMGVIDEVCPRGQGEVAVEKFIASHARQRPARLMLQRSRQRMAPLDRAEMHRIVDEWTETAMSLNGQNIRVMETLARMQRGRANG
jgi:DSF synthase